MKTKSSTYYFLGRLNPQEACVNFNPREIHLKNGWVLDIFMSGISLWHPRITKPFDKILPYVRDLLTTATITFNFITNSRFKIILDNWVEAKAVTSRNNLVGWILSESLLKKLGGKAPSQKNRASVAWRRVGRHVLSIQNSFYHKVALRDFQNCVDAQSEDVLFYAYRMLENIRRASTQDMSPDLPPKEYWNEMHRVLGTTKNMLRPLTTVAERIRHGDIKNRVVQKAMSRKSQLVDLAIRVMRIEFGRAFKGLLH